LLEERGITYFNPIADRETQKQADEAKQNSRYLLFVITDPKVNDGEYISRYNLVESAISVCKHPKRTIVCFLINKDMPEYLQSDLKKIQYDLQMEEAAICDSPETLYRKLEFLLNERIS